MGNIEYFSKNDMLLADGEGYRPPANKKKINLNWWHIKYNQEKQNLGDMLSFVIYNYLCDYYGLDKDRKVKRTRHLYAIGSILFFENQDVTVWGTGSLHEITCNINTILHQRIMRRIDARAVRGPLTRKNLIKIGVACPEIYGDPAMLMPLIYRPSCIDKKSVLVLMHIDDNYSANLNDFPEIIIRDMITTDWREMIDLIATAKCVISSSLHGIILAESYGVPAVLLNLRKNSDLFKFQDYYYGTGRFNIPVVNTIEEGLAFDFDRWSMPNVKMIQQQLILSFPKDLWRS